MFQILKLFKPFEVNKKLCFEHVLLCRKEETFIAPRLQPKADVHTYLGPLFEHTHAHPTRAQRKTFFKEKNRILFASSSQHLRHLLKKMMAVVK